MYNSEASGWPVSLKIFRPIAQATVKHVWRAFTLQNLHIVFARAIMRNVWRAKPLSKIQKYDELKPQSSRLASVTSIWFELNGERLGRKVMIKTQLIIWCRDSSTVEKKKKTCQFNGINVLYLCVITRNTLTNDSCNYERRQCHVNYYTS